MKKRIYLPKLVPLCPLMRSQALSLPVSAKVRYCQYRNWRRHISHSQLNFGGSFFLAPYAVSSPVFAAMVTVFFYLHIFTESVGKRILIVVLVDTLYRTSIISSSTVVLLNPFANLSLAPLSLFSIYGPDLGCGPTVGSPRSSSAPPSLGRGWVVPPPQSSTDASLFRNASHHH